MICPTILKRLWNETMVAKWGEKNGTSLCKYTNHIHAASDSDARFWQIFLHLEFLSLAGSLVLVKMLCCIMMYISSEDQRDCSSIEKGWILFFFLPLILECIDNEDIGIYSSSTLLYYIIGLVFFAYTFWHLKIFVTTFLLCCDR